MQWLNAPAIFLLCNFSKPDFERYGLSTLASNTQAARQSLRVAKNCFNHFSIGPTLYRGGGFHLRILTLCVFEDVHRHNDSTSECIFLVGPFAFNSVSFCAPRGTLLGLKNAEADSRRSRLSRVKTAASAIVFEQPSKELPKTLIQV